MVKQSNEHIAWEGISNTNQLAYRGFHSMEMELLKAHHGNAF